ncbi:alanine racemase, partial [Burkholderia multivorans]
MSSTEPLTAEESAAIRTRLDEVAERTAAAAEASGRSADAVRILLATKTQPAERIRVA